MATVQWIDLPTDIVILIAKILDTDVDTIRLRSVCSSWRASVRRRLRPASFPLRYPPFGETVTGAKLFLNYTTIYHLSPPKFGPHAGDPSDGWLLRVSEVNPNRLSVLAPLFPKLLKFPPETLPKCLNLLDYRISEVCKCYSLMYVKGQKFRDISPIFKKVVVLWNYAVGCEFAVVALVFDGSLTVWKFGDELCTPIASRGHVVSDIAVCKGEFYAISRQGVLVTLDSNFKLAVVDFPRLPAICAETDCHLVEYKSDLYVFRKISTCPEGLEEDPSAFRVEIFKKCNNWKRIECLGNDVLLSSDDYSFGVSVEDFRCLKGNCVYMAHTDHSTNLRRRGRSLLCSVCRLDKGGKTSIMNYEQDKTVVYWPPPEWLLS